MNNFKGIILLCCLLIVAVGCKQNTTNENQDTEVKEFNIDDYEPRIINGPTKVIVDSVGREVVIPENPERLAALYATSGHIITMLDGGDKIVAVNNGLKRDKMLNELEPSFADAALSVVSGQMNIETLLEKQVDLAFIPLDIHMEGRQVKQLDQLNIPYLVVDYQSIEEQKFVVQMIGQVLNNEEEANTFIKFYDEAIEIALSRVHSLNEDELIHVYHSINEANCTVEVDTLPYDWMNIAGGYNVSVGSELEKDGDKYYTNLEQILLWNPEVIYCNESGVDDYILENPKWQYIEAVINKDVKQLPIGISRWGHKTSIETPLAILWVSNDLYPDLYMDVDLMDFYQRFYMELFEFELTYDMYEAMLTGDNMRLSKDLKEGK